jgi:hypothetical protein
MNIQDIHSTKVEDIDWVVLSAESTPERLAQFNSTNGHLGLPVEVVAATEGREVDFRELVQLDLVDPEIHDWDAEGVANALSHWLCWHQAVETQRPTCVFRDSAVLRRDFVPRALGLVDAVPDGWEFLQLGCDTQSGIDFQITPDCRYRGRFTRGTALEEDLEIFVATATPVVPLRLFNAFGAFAYVVTPAGAQRLIDQCFPLATRVLNVPCLRGRIRTTSIDGVMNQFFGSMPAHVCFPPLALSRAAPAATVINSDVDEAAEQRP